MIIKKQMRIIKTEERNTEKGDFYICSFLDEEDDKYVFFVNKDFYNKCKNLKKYDLIDISLQIYQSKNGRYGLGVL